MKDLEYIAGIVNGNITTFDNFKKTFSTRLREIEQENPDSLEAYYYRGALDMLGMALTLENSESLFLEKLLQA